jgi:hypothetical protein
MTRPFTRTLALALTFALASASAKADPAAVTINGRKLGPAEVAALTRALGAPVPPGAFWYDPRSGLYGAHGAGAAGQIAPGLPLGTPPAGCSGPGTGVFVNGRDITTGELALLQSALGPVPPGRYFLEADGRAGREGGPATVNLRAAAAGGARGGAGTFGASSATGSVSGYYDPNDGGSLITVRDASGNAINWSN